MPKQKPHNPKTLAKAKSDPHPALPEDEEPETGTFTEIGGSPVRGLTLRHVLRGHTRMINRLAWSPNGLYLASPSEDKTIRIWDARNGSCVHTLQGHTGTVYCVAWSPDSQRLASSSDDETLCLWDAASGRPLQTLDRHLKTVTSVTWSPDGQRLASASADNTIRLWDAASGQPLRRSEWHTSEVSTVAWSPDGQRLASASEDKTIRLWETAWGQPLQTLRGHTKWVASVAWSPDGQRLASASEDKTIRLWARVTGKALQVLEGHEDAISCVVFSGNGRWLASKSSDDTIRVWRSDTWACVAVLREPSSQLWPPGIAFHPRLPVLATLGERDTIVRIWDLDEALLLSQAQESVHYTTAKLVLVGDSGVGKTGLGWRLAHGEFKEHASTHGQQFWPIQRLGLKRKDNTECEAVLWDLAGQHVYRQIHSIFLENVAAALVLFDPNNRQDPLKGVQFWLEQLKGKGQLPPAVLVGARVDRGAPALSQAELDQFCQRYDIRGGYISTSALKGEGLDTLLETLKAQIPWEEMTATVTTVNFKRIKDYVLALKAKPNRECVLVSPLDLREQLQAADQDWRFTEGEMMTAVGHLETHGYVSVLRSSAGEQHILLTPELLVTLASSIVLLADKHPRELGAVSETELLQGEYPFDELTGLSESESQILLDAAILRFLQHNVCFRETLRGGTLRNEILLIFPALIKQKRLLQYDLPSSENISYVVRGRVENLYASLVVLLGYTPSFTRINQWQNQARYEMGEGEISGFRLVEDLDGEIELVLYYSDQMPAGGRSKFQELFEQFLYQRDVEVTPYPRVSCVNNHQQKRATVIERTRERKPFMFCDECGDKITLPDFDQRQSIGLGASPWLQNEEATARLRSTYEVQLTRVKSYRRAWDIPRCYLSHLPEQAAWAEKVVQDLREAGVYIVEEAAQVQPDDYVILLDTPNYQKAYQRSALALTADIPLINARFGKRQLISLALTGEAEAHEFKECKLGSFCDETHYPIGLFDLVLTLYAIPFTHAGFDPLRQALHEQWERTAARFTERIIEADTLSVKAATMNYQDFQILVMADRKIRASSEQGDEWGELRLDVNKIKLALSLIEKRETDANLLKGLGSELFQALFPNKVNGHWRATRAGAEAAGGGARLRLIFESPELSALPWEFLYDDSTNTFVANDTQTALSRYIDVPLKKRDLASASRPLKILLVISSPTNLAKLDVAEEEALIREALANQVHIGHIELDVVHDATIRNITQQLNAKQYNVFHFVGHGDFRDDKGAIALVEQDGNARLLDEEGFANLFLGNRSIGLAVLNACRSASSSSYRAMTGVAPNLVRRGLPAVVAMQYTILDTTAKQFADEFYRALALGWPVDASIQTTRNAISIEVGVEKRDFATPVLYMRAKDGMILSGL